MQGPRRAVDQGRQKCPVMETIPIVPTGPCQPGPSTPRALSIRGMTGWVGEKGRGMCRRGRRPPRVHANSAPSHALCSWHQAHLIQLMLQRRESYKRTTGKKVLSGVRGLALSHTRSCDAGLYHQCHHGEAGGVQGALYSSSQLHAMLHSSRQKPNGRKCKEKESGWGGDGATETRLASRCSPQ